MFIVVSHAYAWFAPLDRLIYDATISRHSVPLNPDIVIVAIDDMSLSEYGAWPWTRELQARLLNRINEHQPRLVAADIIYSGEHSGSDALTAAAKATPALALPVMIDSLAQGRQPVEVMPYPNLLESADALGHVQIEYDEDAIVRGVHLYQGVGKPAWPHLMVAVAAFITDTPAPVCEKNASDGPLTISACSYVRFPFAGPTGTYPQISASQLLAGNTANAEILERALRDKLVFIGVSALGGGDTVSTPRGGETTPMSGVEFNANLLAAILSDRLIHDASPIMTTGLGVLFTAIACVALPLLRPRQALLTSLATAVGPFVTTFMVLAFAYIHLPLANAIVASILIYPLWSWRRHEIAWAFIQTELDRVDSEQRSLHSTSVGRASLEDALQGLATILRGEVTLTADSAATVQRERALDESEQALLDNTLLNIAQTDPDDALPAERLAAQIGRLRTRARRMREERDIGLAGLGRMSNGAAIVSALGRVHYINDAALGLLGDTEDGVHADFIRQLSKIQPPLGISWTDIWRSAILEKQTHAFESHIVDADGQQHPIFVTAEPLVLGDDHGYAPYWAITFSDLSEIRAAEAQREEALAFLSHDLRSPLTSVLALLQQNEDAHPEARELLNDIRQYTQRGLSTSEQFLQLSRLQLTGQFETYLVELEQVVRNSIDQVFFLATQNSIRINIENDFDTEESCWLDVNGELLERAFVNLLGNAIKYSDPESSIEVYWTAHEDRVTLTIQDHGYGIPEDELKHIFDPYFRSQKEKLAKNRGAGLGLRFVKTVIDRHDGSIEVSSKWGQGTTFRITLPTTAVDVELG